jgi:cell wall-associated NlpC family hydrolase
MTGEQIVSEALTWNNTPYHPAGRVKGVGVDCAQLIYCVYHALGLIPELPAEARSARWFIAHKDAKYLDTILKYAHEIAESDVQPGDLILYRQPSFPVDHHGAIVISWPGTIIHAVRGSGVILGHATDEGFIKSCNRKYFSFIDHGNIR